MNDLSGHRAFLQPVPSPVPSPISSRGFALVLLPGFSLISLSGLTEPMRCANAMIGHEHHRWSLYGYGARTVMSSSGVAVQTEGTLDDIDPACNIILIGGRTLPDPDSAALRSWLRRMSVKAPLLGGVFTAARLLADAGVLDGYRATIHWEMAAGFRECHSRINVSDALFEIDRNRLTCAGEAACTDMMLNIISGLNGRDVASAVAGQLLHIRMRSAVEPQATVSLRTGSRNKYLIRAISLMEENTDEVLDIETIAGKCGCSRRHMERIFRENVGCAPIMYYRNMRLERARQLLLETSMSCIEVAVACGFQSSTTFSNAYFRRFGRRPAKEVAGDASKATTPLAVSLPGLRQHIHERAAA